MERLTYNIITNFYNYCNYKCYIIIIIPGAQSHFQGTADTGMHLGTLGVGLI